MKLFPFLVLGLTSLLISCTEQQPWMHPSNSPSSVPAPTTSFKQYIEQSQEQIHSAVQVRFADSDVSPYLGNYSLQETVAMRSPFQIVKDEQICADQESKKGFLLIHGLTDSPFLMGDIAQSLHQQNPCALIRAVLLPGHGTVAGDSTTMRHQDWQAITEYGVRSFDDHPHIQDLYMVGFSTGTALAIRHLSDSKYTNKITGLILFSTALKANTSFDFLAPTARHFKTWAHLAKEKDAARYESFSMNAGAEFYQLVKGLKEEKYNVDIPVLMAVSSDDTTIDAGIAGDFFCNRVQADTKEMIWYQSNASTLAPPSCTGVHITENGDVHKEFAKSHYLYGSTSHLAITIAPSNPHYGVKGKYRNCKTYSGQDYLNCQSQDQLALFGEKKNTTDMFPTEPPWKYLRRATFNPHYQELEAAIADFIENTASQ